MTSSQLAWAVAIVLVTLASGCGQKRTCGPGTVLDGNTCVPAPADAGTSPDAGTSADGGCTPVCVGRECGDDGCGGSCGTCTDPAAPTCNMAIGRCIGECVPDCAGRNCGDDGCGGSCGTCNDGLSCSNAGRCVPETWTCDAHWYGAGDTCDCKCGAPDPDCADPEAPVARCKSTEICTAEGTCASRVPAAWTCAPTSYDARDKCDCGCGAPDPDCAFTTLPVTGCVGQEPKCNADGTCAACVADCTGKTCGDDGCGGSCGTCTDSVLSACHGGACVSPCDPVPLVCATNDCGDDGCGGSCGTCSDGWSCQSGACVKDPVTEDPLSCRGHCGSVATSGCSCSARCVAAGTCCADYAAACACQPDCTGKTCGDDGCGGSCGTCSGSAPYCNASQQCVAQCPQQCDGAECGDDGCGGTCGTCAAGSTCAWNRKCVPDAWRCDKGLYGDKAGCDCGCGAADPDCAAQGAYTIGCPTSSTACKSSGICDVTFCSSNGGCAPKWCTGAYWAGQGRYQGVCDDPASGAKAPGQPCSWNGECATGVCAEGQCRLYCATDADCASTETCVGLPLRETATGPVRGFVGVCDLVTGSATTCATQAACPGEVCAAFANPATLAPLYLCVTGPATSTIGASCALLSCPAGQMCVSTASGAKCTVACPGGAADCPSGWKCGSTVFHNNGTPATSDDPTVPVCVPN